MFIVIAKTDFPLVVLLKMISDAVKNSYTRFIALLSFTQVTERTVRVSKICVRASLTWSVTILPCNVET